MKKLLLALLLMIPNAVHASIPVASGFSMGSALPLDLRMQVADNTARNAISAGIRWEGMLVYSIGSGVLYELVGGITNSNWAAVGGGGSGTVTAVGLVMPAEFSTTPSSISTSGTFVNSWTTQSANFVFAAPSGGSGTPGFRLLVNSDIPALNYVNTVGSYNFTPTSEGLKITGSVVQLTDADSTHPGGVSTGNQPWQGEKTFLNPPRMSLIKNISGTQIVDLANSGINDQAGNLSFDGQLRRFSVVGGNIVYDYSTQTMYDLSNIRSGDFNSRLLIADTNFATVDYNSGVLSEKTAGATTVDFFNFGLYASSVLRHNWNTGEHWDSSSFVSLNTENRNLYDNAGNSTMDYSSPTGPVVVGTLGATAVVATTSITTPTLVLNGVSSSSAASPFISFSSGLLSSIVAGEMIGNGQSVRGMIIENMVGAAGIFSGCISNPVIALLDCGPSAGPCASGGPGVTLIATLALAAPNSITTTAFAPYTFSAGNYWAFELTGGSCASISVNGSAEFVMQ